MKPYTIVLSGINMAEGGIFTILDNCLQKISVYSQDKNLRIVALVHDKSKFNYPDIEYIEFPKSKKNWFMRIFYEYFYFKKLSKKLQPDIWFSLHDVSPNVEAKKRFVYCHHPTIFFKPSFNDWKFDYKTGVFSILYKYLYQINIKKNNAVFVQQNWIKTAFEKLYSINNIIVTTPENVTEIEPAEIFLDPTKIHFFYPSFPRSFKNFELIAEAVQLLPDSIKNKIEIHLTLANNDNNYSRSIAKKYNLEPLKFIGKISRSEVFGYYKKMDCLIFPSKLETWGLPLSETKAFQKPILCSNLPYAKETVGDYEKVCFFDVDQPKELAFLITQFVNKTIVFDGNQYSYHKDEQFNDWDSVFNFILKD